MAVSFPIIHLDHNATTQPSPGVIDAVTHALREAWGNPSSVHRAGQQARQLLELARAGLAELIHARPREITLTGSGTEAIDLAIRGTLAAVGRPGRHTLITTRLEHAAVRDLAEALEKTGEAKVIWAPVTPDGRVDMAAFETLLTPDVALVSIQWANNETGAIQPVGEIARLCRESRIAFHCDATQWVGKMPTFVHASPGSPPPEHLCPCDLLTFAPHKFHGPKGVGVLWARQGAAIRPTIHGTQELGRRGGTENTSGILGSGVAAREALAWLADPAERDRLAALRDAFEARILELVPDAAVNGPTAPAARLWNTTNIGFPRLEAEALLLLLSERGVYASAGAACSSGSLDPSPVLLAMGVPEAYAHGSLRFSLSRHTTAEQLEEAAAEIAACVERLKQSL